MSLLKKPVSDLNSSDLSSFFQVENRGRGLLEFFDSQIFELDFGAMTTQTEMTGFPFQAGMIFAVDGTVFLGVGHIEVDDGCAIQCDFDFIAIHQQFLGVPLADGLQVTAFGRGRSIKGTVILVFL